MDLTVHGFEELFVGLGTLKALLHEFHSLYAGHVGKVVSEDPDAVGVFRLVQKIVTSG
jgi:hypothetical protein